MNSTLPSSEYMFIFDPTITIGDIFTIIGAIAAAIGLFYTALKIKNDARVRELASTESVFKDIQALAKELDEYNQKADNDKETWDFRFFNQLEWFSFLVNHKKIKDAELVSFFSDSIIEWYEKIFLVHMDKEIIDDPKQFEEFKKLYTKFKNN